MQIAFPPKAGKHQIDITCPICNKSKHVEVTVTDKSERVRDTRIFLCTAPAFFCVLFPVVGIIDMVAEASNSQRGT